MTRAGPFLAYVAAVLVLGAVLTYPAWLALHALGFDAVPAHKLALRLCEVLALVGLVPLLAWLGAPGARSWGVSLPGAGIRDAVRAAGAGLGLGALMLVPVVLALLALGARSVDPEWGEVNVPVLLAKAALAALAVALVEEAWFRGGLHGAIAHRFNVVAAVVATALLYAAVHFVRADQPVDAAEARWASGFEALAGAFGRFRDPGIADAFVALAAAGTVLSLLRVLGGHIWWCVGVHAGWVVAIKVTRGLTRDEPASAWAWLAGGYDGVIGPLAAVWFATVAALIVAIGGGRRGTTP